MMADAFFQHWGGRWEFNVGYAKATGANPSTLQCVPPDVSVSLGDGRAFVSDQRHDNGVRNASILEQADRGVT